MDLTTFIIFVIIGGVAGWLAGIIMRGAGFGVLGNIIVGIIGAFLGGWLIGNVFHLALTSNGYVNYGIYALVGAIIILFIISLIKKAK